MTKERWAGDGQAGDFNARRTDRLATAKRDDC